MKPTFKNKRSWLLGTAALALAVSNPAYAQDAAAEEDETATLDVVKVTGIRGSIQDSLREKKNATSIIEAISAEDIGKLPDLSIADSLARLPGVTAQRVRGRSQQISIRGLGPDFSLALWNGREVVSAGNNRGVEFDQFPSELVAQGIVYKTPDAALAATGIAGAVDLRTVRPLDYTERKLNFSGKYVLNDNDQPNPDFDEDGYRLFGSYIDQNEAGTIGWSLAATIQSNPTQFTSRELKTNSGQTAVDSTTGLVFPNDNPRTGVSSREFERTSIAGALQFEPNDRWSTTIDGFYTDTEDAGIFRGVETPLAIWSGVGDPALTGTSGFADTATYTAGVDGTTGTPAILRTDTEGNTAEILAIGLNSSYAVNDRLTLTADISRSELDRNDIDYESYAGTGGQIFPGYDFGNNVFLAPRDPSLLSPLTFNFDPDGEYSISSPLDYANPGNIVLTDPGGWGQVGFLKQPKIEDELTQLRLEAEYELDNEFISGIKVGLIQTDREKTFDSNESFLRAGAGWTETVPGNARTAQLAIPTVIGTTNSGNIGLDIVAYDPSSFLTDGTYTVEKANFDTEWTVEEEITTLYAMADIDTVLNGLPLRGNVGFQYQDVDQSSTANLQRNNDAGTRETQTGGITDEYFLPSLNLSLEVADDTFLRFAAAKTVTRPRLDALAFNQNVTINNQICSDTDGDFAPDTLNGFSLPVNPCFNISGGNPTLNPYQSTSLDVSFERYFGDTTAVSIAVFHKELEDWIETVPSTVDISSQLAAIGIPALDAFVAANPEVATAVTSFPENFADGTITGIEATVRMSLDDYLPFDGLGFNASYTYADSSLNSDVNGEIRIPGYSDNVWSGDIYYENHGWRSRISARHRSGFSSEVPQFDGSLTAAEAQEETIVDLQIGYEWDEGALEGFGLNFEVFNLTDEPFVTEAETADPSVTFPSRHEMYGTTYNLTVTKSF